MHNGNKPQGEIAWNTINRLGDQYGLTENQKSYLYYDYLGYKDSPDHKVKGDTNEIGTVGKGSDLQMWDQIVGSKYQKQVMKKSEFSAWCQSNPREAAEKYGSNYQNYLAAKQEELGFSYKSVEAVGKKKKKK